MEVDIAIRDAAGRMQTKRVSWLPKRASDGVHLAGVVIHTRPEVVQWISGDVMQRVLRDLESNYAIGHFLNTQKGTINIAITKLSSTEPAAMNELLATLRVLEDKIRALEEALQSLEAHAP
ncbi:MAG: hypothetical protein ACOY5C_13850 [Pseudomonadota bacterium]